MRRDQHCNPNKAPPGECSGSPPIIPTAVLQEMTV